MSFISISLNIFERKFLLYIASNHNEITLNHRDISLDVVKALKSLESKGAVSKVLIIGSPNSYIYKLTSIGTNLVDLIKERSND